MTSLNLCTYNLFFCFSDGLGPEMVISIQDIPKEGLDLSYLEPAEKLGFTESSFQGPLSISLHLTKEGREVSIEGKIVAREILECSRCIADVVHPVQVEFRVGCFPLNGVQLVEEVQLHKRDLDMVFYSDDRIELSNLVQGQLVLARPMRPLCKSDCLGLCQICGLDLNSEPCGCVKEMPDSRFSVLMRLKQTNEKG